ncbi:unnamed protein product, partial [marine sediment metagenome]
LGMVKNSIANSEGNAMSWDVSPFIKNLAVLQHSYVPEQLLYRDEQLNDLISSFKYVVNGSPPSHLHLDGSKGTGKTLTLNHVLKLLRAKLKNKKRSPLVTYTMSQKYSYSTLLAIISSLGLDVRKIREISMGLMWRNFEAATKGKLLVVCLDEIDKLADDPHQDLMYFLTRRPKTCVVTVSNIPGAIEKIAQNPKLDFRYHTISFPK